MPGGDFDTWAESMRQNSPRFDFQFVRVDEILGRAADMYEFSDVGALLNEEGTVATGAVARMWIDQQTGMVLRYESSPVVGGQLVTAEMTVLELNPEIEESLFTFMPPEDAQEVQASHEPITVVAGSGNPDSQLLELAFVTGDLRLTSSSTSASTSGTERSEGTWTGSDGRTLRVRQFLRLNGFPAGLITGEAVNSPEAPHESPYYVSRSPEHGLISLAWQYNDVTVMMDGIGIELDELISIADSIGSANE